MMRSSAAINPFWSCQAWRAGVGRTHLVDDSRGQLAVRHSSRPLLHMSSLQRDECGSSSSAYACADARRAAKLQAMLAAIMKSSPAAQIEYGTCGSGSLLGEGGRPGTSRRPRSPGTQALHPAVGPWLFQLSFRVFPTPSDPEWQDAWAVGRWGGKEAH